MQIRTCNSLKHIGGAVDRMLTQPAIIILGEFLIRQIIGLQCQIEALQLAGLQFITDLGVNNGLAANALIVLGHHYNL